MFCEFLQSKLACPIKKVGWGPDHRPPANERQPKLMGTWLVFSRRQRPMKTSSITHPIGFTRGQLASTVSRMSVPRARLLDLMKVNIHLLITDPNFRG